MPSDAFGQPHTAHALIRDLKARADAAHAARAARPVYLEDEERTAIVLALDVVLAAQGPVTALGQPWQMAADELQALRGLREKVRAGMVV